LSAGSNSLDELALYVGLLGIGVQIHEPPKLGTEAAGELKRGRSLASLQVQGILR
jgi:hypothetical protein